MFLNYRAIIVCLFAIGILPIDARAEGVFNDWPIAITCDRGERALVGYLSAVKEDGSAIYQTLGARHSVSVTSDGIIEKSPSMSEGLSCVGQSISDLRKEGKTFDVPQ